MITIEQAKSLTPGTTLYYKLHKNADGTPQRWRVNGKPKTWKTRPSEVQVPIKWGLKTCAYMKEDSLHLFSLIEAEAK